MATDKKPAISDAKKRALKALERRVVAAKAELQQSEKNKKRAHEHEDDGIPTKHSSSKAPNMFSPMLSSKTGQFASSDCTPSQKTSRVPDEENSGPAYFQLSQPVHDNLLMIGTELSSRRGDISNKIIHELLLNGDSAQKYMQGSRSMKIDNWLLLDSFVHQHATTLVSCLRATKSRTKCSKRHMSMQQHRKCGSFDLPQEFHNFNLFKPIHEMWKDYMNQLLKNNETGQFSQSLLNADLHGAILLVVECKIRSFTGTSGIMIRETTETFGIITKDNKFQVVPKKGSVFIFQADCWKITLLGDKLSLRNTGC